MKMERNGAVDNSIWVLLFSAFLIFVIILSAHISYSDALITGFDRSVAGPEGPNVLPRLLNSLRFFPLALVLMIAFYFGNKKMFKVPRGLERLSADINQRISYFVRKRIYHLLILSVGITLGVFIWGYGIVSKGIFMNYDYPFYYHAAWFTINYSFPLFNSILSWDPYFYAGFPMMYFYNPGMVLSVVLLNKLSLGFISVSSAYKIFIITTLALTPFSGYFLSRKFGFSKCESSIMTLLLIIPTTHYFQLITFAMVSLLTAIALSAIIFGLFHKYHSTKSLYYLVLVAILYSITILLHFIVALAIFLGFISYIALSKNDSYLRSLLVIILLCAVSVSLSAFWLIPSTYNHLSGYGKSNTHILAMWIITSLSGVLSYALSIILSIPVLLWPFIVFGYINLRENKSQTIQQKFILAYPALLLIFMFFGASPYSPIQKLQLMHLQPYVGYYLVFVAGSSLIRFSKTNSFNRSIAAISVVIVVLLPSISVILAFSDAEGPFLKTELPKSVREVFGFIKANADDKTRVLLEDYRYYVNYKNQADWGPGYTTALAPILIGKDVKFIGGFFPFGNHFKNDDLATVRGGIFFGVPLENISHEFLLKRASEFNIKYLVVWSNLSKNYLNDSNDFIFLEGRGNFSIYEYKNAPESYIVGIRGDASAEVVDFGAKDIILRVTANETSNITISSSYFPNWHAYIDGSEIPVAENDIFVMVTVPEINGEMVRVTFEQGFPEKMGMLISVVAWLLILSWVFLRFRVIDR